LSYPVSGQQVRIVTVGQGSGIGSTRSLGPGRAEGVGLGAGIAQVWEMIDGAPKVERRQVRYAFTGAEGDSRSAANKVRKHESRSVHKRARGNAGGRVGVSVLGDLTLGGE
jgi:hypothetical protein